MKIPRNIQMIIFDMAGTVVNDKGLVCNTLYNTMKAAGLNINEENIHNWHGRNKQDILDEELKSTFPDYSENEFTTLQLKLHTDSERNLLQNYMKPGNLSLMDEGITDMFNEMRTNYYKICLNTGYPNYIQKFIVRRLGLDKCTDSYIASDEVRGDRPLPYMIHTLMDRHHIRSSENVMKVGDTSIDMLEGITARCGKTVGVLTGTGTKNELYKSGASNVIGSVMDLEYTEV